MNCWQYPVRCAITPIYITQTYHYNTNGVSHVVTKAIYKGVSQTQVIKGGNLIQRGEELLRTICYNYKFCRITINNGGRKYCGEAWNGKLDINFKGGNNE